MRLVGHKAPQAVRRSVRGRRADAPDTPIGAPIVADLTRAHELLHGLEDIADRDGGIITMQPVEIDPIGAQKLQALRDIEERDRTGERREMWGVDRFGWPPLVASRIVSRLPVERSQAPIVFSLAL